MYQWYGVQTLVFEILQNETHHPSARFCLLVLLGPLSAGNEVWLYRE